MKKISFLLIMSSILLAGDSKEAKTKEYFEAHLDEAKAKYKECFAEFYKGRMNGNKIFATECENAEVVIKGILEKERGEKETPEALPTLVTDLEAYYASQAKFENKLSDMTNVKIMNENGLSGSVGVQDKPCINVSIVKKEKASFLKMEKVNNPDKVCSKIFSDKTTEELLNKKETPITPIEF